MTKTEMLFEIGRACPDLANEILALEKRLDKNGEFSSPAKAANEDRFKKLCRDALQVGNFPDSIRGELEKEEASLWTHGGYRPGSGRPALPEEELRKARSIKFSDIEWEAAREKADAAGLSISEYIRDKVLD